MTKKETLLMVLEEIESRCTNECIRDEAITIAIEAIAVAREAIAEIA